MELGSVASSTLENQKQLNIRLNDHRKDFNRRDISVIQPT